MLETIMLCVGVSGVIAIAMNFILEISNKLDKEHKIFSLLNLYGSLTLFIYAFYGKVWLFVVLNGFLILVGLYGIWKVFFKK